jgi:hypothetical protein
MIIEGSAALDYAGSEPSFFVLKLDERYDNRANNVKFTP